MKRYLYIGRFQPFHNEHLNCIKRLTKDGEIIVVIGSAQENWTKKNPFTASERFEMMWEAIQQNSLTAYVTIVPIVDIVENHLWVKNIQAMVPAFDVVYSNNPLSRGLFEAEGFKVEPKEPERNWISASTVRKRIIEDGEWVNLVPEAVADYITCHKLDKRLKVINKEE